MKVIGGDINDRIMKILLLDSGNTVGFLSVCGNEESPDVSLSDGIPHDTSLRRLPLPKSVKVSLTTGRMLCHLHWATPERQDLGLEGHFKQKKVGCHPTSQHWWRTSCGNGGATGAHVNVPGMFAVCSDCSDHPTEPRLLTSHPRWPPCFFSSNKFYIRCSLQGQWRQFSVWSHQVWTTGSRLQRAVSVAFWVLFAYDQQRQWFMAGRRIDVVVHTHSSR